MQLPTVLEDAWDDFRRSRERKNRSAATLQVYRKSFEQFWTWALEAGVSPDPEAVDHSTINQWSTYLLDAPAVRNGRVVGTITPATRRIRFANLRPFFGWYAREFETANPFDRADAPGDAQPAPIPVVELDDVRALVKACSGRDFADRRDNAIIRVLFDTGARLGELLALTSDDWDRRHDRLTLRGKTGTRIVPVSANTGEALSRYLRVRREHAHARRAELWLGPKGALTASGVAQVLKRRCALAGIEPIHPHQARHTFAHTFRATGGGEGDLMYLAGWKSTAMAHRYGRSAAAERAQAAARKHAIGDHL
ncbi:MAG TPA: tyrosine-type recombinase/integrase [Acidimicrobiia bacterium]|nr:tyrosine-type recombinase/integrase [Acidimicrobiia bacterium]